MGVASVDPESRPSSGFRVVNDSARVTLVIRTLNAGPWLADLLPCLADQRRRPDELLIVDSGSSDGTVDRILAVGLRLVAPDSPFGQAERCRIVTIPGSEFTHARSTNLGFREARGDLVVMLSQDALPLDAGWLGRLIAPMETTAGSDESAVAAAFGRQIARPDVFPPERWQIEVDYPAEALPESNRGGVLFSNVNSVARRSAWQEEPFDESLLIAEDRVWAAHQLARGRRIAYVPGAAVRHSHDYSVRATAARCEAESRVRRQSEGLTESVSLLFKAWPRQTLADLGRLGREGRLLAWPRAAVYRFAQFYGMWRGGRG